MTVAFERRGQANIAPDQAMAKQPGAVKAAVADFVTFAHTEQSDIAQQVDVAPQQRMAAQPGAVKAAVADSMAAASERTPQAAVASDQATAAQPGAIQASFADFWPTAMIGLGAILTLIWTGGLMWLLLMVLGLI